jgi:hypothetical protein
MANPVSFQEIVTLERKQWEGRIIDGRFHLRQYLGGSPHSAVFSTEFGEGTPQKAAIKLVPAGSGKADAWMLRRELAAKLSHPGLLSILQFGTWRIDGAIFAYVVMEASDEDLSQVIPTRPLTAVEARELLLAVVEILAYVHAQGFVHGRLTPANLMAAGEGIKISSDGLLRVRESSDNLWTPNANDPPESRSGMTAAGDVWWLGMTLVEALTQQALAWDRTRTEDPVVPETLGTPFCEIARRCLRSDPRLRCSLAEISLALQPEGAAPRACPRVVEAAPAAKPVAPAATKKRKYLLPVVASALAGVVATGAILSLVSSCPWSPRRRRSLRPYPRRRWLGKPLPEAARHRMRPRPSRQPGKLFREAARRRRPRRCPRRQPGKLFREAARRRRPRRCPRRRRSPPPRRRLRPPAVPPETLPLALCPKFLRRSCEPFAAVSR